MSVNSTENYLSKAAEFFKQKDFKKALYACSQAISVILKTLKPTSRGANIRRELGEDEKALIDYDKAISIEPQCLEAYLGRAKCRDNEHNITDYGSALAIDPQCIDAYLGRADALRQLGRNEKAIIDYDKVVEINPESAEALYERARAKSSLGNKKGALSDYDMAIAVNPDFSAAYFYRASFKKKQGDFKGYINDLTKITEISDLSTYFHLAYMDLVDAKREAGNLEGLIVVLDNVIKNYPEDGDALSKATTYIDRANASGRRVILKGHSSTIIWQLKSVLNFPTLIPIGEITSTS